MFSLRDLRFALCSLDFLRITRAKDHRLFSLNYPQISEVGKVDHVVISHVTKLEDIFFSFICTTNCFIYRYPPLPPSPSFPLHGVNTEKISAIIYLCVKVAFCLGISSLFSFLSSSRNNSGQVSNDTKCWW